MRDEGYSDTRHSGTPDWIGGLAQEALELLAKSRASTAQKIQKAHLDFLMEMICRGSAVDDPAIVYDAMRARHLSTRVIAERYVPEAARLLGRHWEEDRISFLDVTLCTGRLFDVLRHIDMSSVEGRSDNASAVLVLVPEAEQHTLGAVVVAGSLRRAGFSVCLRIAPDVQELKHLVTATPFEMALVSVSCMPGLTGSATMIKALRLVSCGNLRIIAGGPIPVDDETVLDISGADTVARDIEAIIADYNAKLTLGVLD